MPHRGVEMCAQHPADALVSSELWWLPCTLIRRPPKSWRMYRETSYVGNVRFRCAVLQYNRVRWLEGYRSISEVSCLADAVTLNFTASSRLSFLVLLVVSVTFVSANQLKEIHKVNRLWQKCSHSKPTTKFTELIPAKYCWVLCEAWYRDMNFRVVLLLPAVRPSPSRLRFQA